MFCFLLECTDFSKRHFTSATWRSSPGLSVWCAEPSATSVRRRSSERSTRPSKSTNDTSNAKNDVTNAKTTLQTRHFEKTISNKTKTWCFKARTRFIPNLAPSAYIWNGPQWFFCLRFASFFSFRFLYFFFHSFLQFIFRIRITETSCCKANDLG